MSESSPVDLTLSILLDSIVESYSRLRTGLLKTPSYTFAYLDMMAFLGCVDQIGNILGQLEADENLKDIASRLSTHVHEARNYYQHINGRIKESLRKNDIVLGVISWSEQTSPGTFQIGGSAILSGTNNQIIPIPMGSLLSKDEPAITLDIKTKGTDHHIDLTLIKNEVIELKTQLK